MHTALLDTCVLWPSLQRDFLLSLAVDSVYRPLWSDTTLDELEFHEERKLVERGMDEELASARAQHLIGRMRIAFDDAEVTDGRRVKSLGLPDVDDEHVAASAIVGGADVIVTDNHKDFPKHLLPGALATIGGRLFIDEMCATEPADAALGAGGMAGWSDRVARPRAPGQAATSQIAAETVPSLDVLPPSSTHRQTVGRSEPTRAA